MGMPIGSQYFKSLLHLPGRHASYQRRFASTKVSEPLHVLFCGSEEFSIASLQTLHKEHQKNPELIASIDVVCRPAKRVGRNLKLSREGNDASAARKRFYAEMHQCPYLQSQGNYLCHFIRLILLQDGR